MGTAGKYSTGADDAGLVSPPWDGDLRRWAPVDALRADGMQEVWGSSLHISSAHRNNIENLILDPYGCTAAKYSNAGTSAAAHQFGYGQRAEYRVGPACGDM
jgi:hypothetical protein